jgi:nucleoside-diphosphate-sugar epimerase
VLVTGATGKIGNSIALALGRASHEVRVLVRDPGRAGSLLSPEFELVRGDVTDWGTLGPAVDGCEVVFNAMGLPEQWLSDETLFERVNAHGSANLARAAAAAGVRRFVHTSTIDVFDAPPGGRFDESALAAQPKQTAYERSKQQAERAVLQAAGGMDVVFVNPAVAYGPGPTASASVDRMFRLLLRGLFPAVPPGGFGVVFTEGLAQGHLLAAELGKPGQRYLFSDEHVTMMRLAKTVVSVAGRGRAPVMTIPAGVAKAMAAAGESLARMTGRPPLLARGQLHLMLWNAVPDSTKAQRELGWTPTPLETGLRPTLEAIQAG